MSSYLPVPTATAPPSFAVAPAMRPHGPSTLAVLAWVGFGLLAAVTGAITVLLITLSTGLSGLAVGSLLALIPVAPLVAFYLWLDRYEREPPSLLTFAFVWGAAVATFAALILNTASDYALVSAGHDASATAVAVAPFVEELFKGLAVLLVFLVRRHEFDGVVDGLVYAGMVGIGFAFVENILYLGSALADQGVGGLTGTFVMRCVFAPFAHPMFTSATGIGIGIAARSRNVATRILAPIGGYLAAVGLHALWNFSASLGNSFILLYLVVQVPLFTAYIVLAVLSTRREARLITRHMSAYAAAGWLTPADAAMLGSMRVRRQARAWATRVAGSSGAVQMRRFQALATELAFLRERITRGTAGPRAPEQEYASLLGIAHLRATLPPLGAR